MMSYQVPSKAVERTFCSDNADECTKHFGLPSDATAIPASGLEVRKSTISDMAGRGIFASQVIPRHSVIGLDLQVNNFFVLPSVWKIIDSMYDMHNQMDSIDNRLFQGLLYFIQGKNSSSNQT